MKNLFIVTLLLFACASLNAQNDTKVYRVFGKVYFSDADTDNSSGKKYLEVDTLLTFEQALMGDTLFIEQLARDTEFKGRDIERMYVNVSENPDLTWDEKNFVLYPQELMTGKKGNFKVQYEKWSQGRYAIDDARGIELFMKEKGLKSYRTKVAGQIIVPLFPFLGIASLVYKHQEHQALRVLTYLEGQ